MMYPQSPKTSYKRFYRLFFKRHFFGITSPFPVLPNFFVIRAGRTGTTSLFHYLFQHPSITKSADDELGFFDVNYHLGLNWYRSLFPSVLTKIFVKRKTKAFLTYDVTPSYVRKPWVARRIHDMFPSTKLIVVLRNPVDKSYSQYHESVTLGEKRTFEHVIKEDMDNILKWKTELKDDNYFATVVENSILGRGLYAEQLPAWFDLFSKNQIMIIQSEKLSSDTKNVMNDVFQFLGLPIFDIPNTKKVNVLQYSKMNPETRELLINFFKPYNEKLFGLLGKKFNWNDE